MNTITTEAFWDCECPENYIHPKTSVRCDLCQAERDSQPDSRVEEVLSKFGDKRIPVSWIGKGCEVELADGRIMKIGSGTRGRTRDGTVIGSTDGFPWIAEYGSFYTFMIRKLRIGESYLTVVLDRKDIELQEQLRAIGMA